MRAPIIALLALVIFTVGCSMSPDERNSPTPTPTPAPVDSQPPTAPTNIVVTALSSSSIDVMWDASIDVGSSGVAGYRVRRNGSTVATVTTNRFTDSGLHPSTQYSYAIVAFDAAGNQSNESSSASATTNASTVTVHITINGLGVVEDLMQGFSCTTSCTREVTQGALLSLSARPLTGYAFVSWAGDCSGTQTCNATADNAVDIIARFIPASTPPMQDSGSDLFVPSRSQGTVEVTLHPGPTVQLGSVTKVAFGVPFPRGFLFDLAQLRVTDANGIEIPSSVSDLSRWRRLDGTPANESVRAVLIYVEYTFQSASPTTITVEWGAVRTATLAGAQPPVTTLWVPISSGIDAAEFPSSDDIREPAVYATLPPDWLGQTLLRTRTLPINPDGQLGWFDINTLNFGRTAVNEVASTVTAANLVNYTGSEEPWLFDRSLTLFGLYFRTGDLRWLRHAHRSAQWYAKKVDANGIFSLASYNHDLKYSYGLSLLTDLYLTGDSTLTAPILRIATAGEREWQTTYSAAMRFWTERHHTYALLAALSAFEITGQAQYATRATDLAQLTISMSQNAANCPLHTVEQHEGNAGDLRMMCSPWMTGLLADAMLHYYIHSEDSAVLVWLAGIGDYVRDFAVYDGGTSGDTSLTGIMMPWYMVGPAGRLEDGLGWGDVEHTCDVAGLAAKSIWAKGQLGQDTAPLRATTSQLLSSCQYIQNYWHRAPNSTAPEWRLTPSRKFNWWFGATTDLTWMLSN